KLVMVFCLILSSVWMTTATSGATTPDSRLRRKLGHVAPGIIAIGVVSHQYWLCLIGFMLWFDPDTPSRQAWIIRIVALGLLIWCTAADISSGGIESLAAANWKSTLVAIAAAVILSTVLHKGQQDGRTIALAAACCFAAIVVTPLQRDGFANYA